MLKTIVLCASLVLPTLAFAAESSAPAQTSQTAAPAASKSTGTKVKGVKKSPKVKSQGRSGGQAQTSAKRPHASKASKSVKSASVAK